MLLARAGRRHNSRQQGLSMLVVAIIINPAFSNPRLGQAAKMKICHMQALGSVLTMRIFWSCKRHPQMLNLDANNVGRLKVVS